MIRLKIKKHDDKHIKLEALSDIENYGFGTFLCNLKPEEIECDEFSKQAMIKATAKGGLNGMEIWADNRIAWGSPSKTIIMPTKEISKAFAATDWLSQISPKERSS